MKKSSEPKVSSQIAEVVGKQILKLLESKEEELDEEIRHLERADDDDLERLRQNRLKELKRNALEIEKWTQLGHGKYDEVDEKDFFQLAKNSPNMVGISIGKLHNLTQVEFFVVRRSSIFIVQQHVDAKF